MKIEIANARDGGTIRMDGEPVGHISYYRGGGGESYVRFGDGSRGTHEAVARIKYAGYTAAKKWAREALKAAEGDYKALAARGKAGIWGTDLIESFDIRGNSRRMLDELVRSKGWHIDKHREQRREIALLKDAIKTVENVRNGSAA